MRRSLLEILACPIDKHYPLQLFEIIVDGEIIDEGLLFCDKCSRFYPIVAAIPIMLPDELREREKDLELLRKWQDKIPEKIIKQGNPWHL